MPYGVRCASEEDCLLGCCGLWFGVARSENCPFSFPEDFKAAFVSNGKVWPCQVLAMLKPAVPVDESSKSVEISPEFC